MMKRGLKKLGSSIPLTLDGENRIVFPSQELVFGWFLDANGQSAAEPQPLRFPMSLLEPKATAGITYACNLPSPFEPGSRFAANSPFLDETGMLPAVIPMQSEHEFLSASAPGGQTAIFDGAGERGLVRLRWVCVAADRSIGAFWRRYAQVRWGGVGRPWRATEGDYLFDAEGQLAAGPATVSIALGTDQDRHIRLTHPAGGLTQLPCAFGLVKVAKLSADGWARRGLEDLRMFPAGGVAAVFSDGSQMLVATAALNRIGLARAA